TAEPIEDRPAREIREFADGPQAEQSQLFMHLHIDGEHIERQRRQERAAIIDRAHLARWGSLRHDASEEGRRRDPRRCAGADARAPRQDVSRHPTGCAEELFGAGEIAGERTRIEHAHARERRVERREEPAMQLGRIRDDDRERYWISQTATLASSARVPRSAISPASDVTQKSARSLACARPTANDHPTVRSNRRSHATRSNENVGIATRRPGSPATTRSAAGDPRTAESAGAMSSTFVPPNARSPTSTTTRRKPSLRSAAAVASARCVPRARTTMSRSRSTLARCAAMGSNDDVGSIHAAIPPCACADAVARRASWSLPTLGGPMNAMGSPAMSPPPITSSSDDFVAMTSSLRLRWLVLL